MNRVNVLFGQWFLAFAASMLIFVVIAKIVGLESITVLTLLEIGIPSSLLALAIVIVNDLKNGGGK